PQDRPRILLRLEARVGPELIGRVPEVLLQSALGGVLLGRGDPAGGGESTRPPGGRRGWGGLVGGPS
ncbi:MAG: hypothetical protein ACK55I_34920, partial [bacterium]